MDAIRTYSASETAAALEKLIESIRARHPKLEQVRLIAVANGGVFVLERIRKILSEREGLELHTGTVNISYHRDDIGTRPIPMVSHPTYAPFDIDDATVILIDDVANSGRSCRAALNEVFDLGRPARVELAALFDRQNYRLPVRCDYAGITQPISAGKRVQVWLDLEDPQKDNIQILSDE